MTASHRHVCVVGLTVVCLVSTVAVWLAKDAWAQQEFSPEVSELIETLHHENPHIRIAAARDLAFMGQRAGLAIPALIPAIPALIEALNDKVNEVGFYAAEALKIVGAPAVPALIKAVQGQSKGVRFLAAHVKSIGPEARAATPALIEVLNDNDTRVRNEATAALAGIGPSAVSSLITALEKGGERVRSGAATALGQMEPPAHVAIPTLSKALLADASEDVRAACAIALGKMGPEAYAAIPTLRQALSEDASVKVRQAAAEALGKMGPQAKEAVPVLIKALADRRHRRGDPEGVYPKAAVALGQIGAAAQSAIPALVEAMKQAIYDDRDLAAEALVRIAQDLQDQAWKFSIVQLQDVISMLNKAVEDLQGQAPPDVRRALQRLEDVRQLQQQDPINAACHWMAQHPLVAGVALYVVLALCLWFGMLWLRPLWLLKINEGVKSLTDFALPAWRGGIKVPVSLVLLVGFFHYHPRVLDAWVATHIASVRARFARKDTVRNRQVHIPVPRFPGW